MPRRCSVPGCHSNYDTQCTYTAAFLFPKNEELHNKWISSINRKYFTPGPSAVVCVHHFDERFIIREDTFTRADGSIVTIPRKKLSLTKDAYPTVFLNQPHYLSKTLPKVRKAPSERMEEMIKHDDKKFQQWCETDKITSLHDVKEAIMHRLSDSWYYKEQENCIFIYKLDILDSPKVTISLQILSNLSVKLFYEGVGIDTKGVLSFAIGDELKLDKWTKMDCVLSYLNSFQAKEMPIDQKLRTVTHLLGEIIDKDIEDVYSDKVKFISEQLILALSKQHKYNSEAILWAANLYFKYPAAYSMIRKSGILTLPHQSYLRNLTASLNSQTEVNSHIQYLKQKASMLKNEEKVVNLLLDEIYINPKFDYKGGNVVGVADNSDDCIAATTVQTFMISSLFSKNKDVVSLIPVKNLTANQLHKYTISVLDILHDCGFVVLCLISDNNRINRNMFSAMCGGELKTSIQNPYDDSKKIFFLFDTPHIVKSLRNNWLNQSATNQTFFYPNPTNMLEINIASIQHLKQIYDAEKNMTVKTAPKLSRKVLFPTSMERQNVNHALSLFHETNVIAIEESFSRYHTDFLKTKIFLEHIQRWWKIVNCKHPFKGKHTRDTYSDPITSMEHPNIAFLRLFYKWINKWKDLNDLASSDKALLALPEKGGMLSKETEFALSHTCKTLIAVAEYILEVLKANYVLLGKLQTDSLEARFGQFRQMSGGNYNISFRQMTESEKKLKILSMIKLYSEKTGEFTLKSLDCSDHSSAGTVSNPNVDYFIDIIHSSDGMKITAPTMSVLIYIAGYVAFKVQKGIVCGYCIASLSTSDTLQCESQCDEFKYLQQMDRGGLKWPTQFTIDVVLIAFKIFEMLISESYESTFLKYVNLKDILTELTMKKIIVSNNICAIMCSCGVLSDTLLKKCISVISNILINNYCKAKNETALLKNNSKRKLSTLSCSGIKKPK